MHACRSAISAAQKDGVKVEELGKMTPQLIAEMKEVDKAWVDARGEHAGTKLEIAAVLLRRLQGQMLPFGACLRACVTPPLPLITL